MADKKEVKPIKLKSNIAAAVAQPEEESSAKLFVDTNDVIRLMLQYCHENNLKKSFAALQAETQVSLNTVDNVENFLTDIRTGNWDAVLTASECLNLPIAKSILLFEQIVLELIELREIEVARAMLRQSEPLQKLKAESPERYIRLEHLCSQPFFDIHMAYPDGTNKEKRRVALANELADEVTSVPPSRLLVLLGQSLKWQQYQGLLPAGTDFDVFRGVCVAKPDVEDLFPRNPVLSIKFGKNCHAESVTFSNDAQYFVSGSVDGLIEVWDLETGALRTDLRYQADDAFMMHEDSVLSLAFSRDSEQLASGSHSGKIKVWKIKTGQCVRRFESAHGGGVTCLCFNRDGTQVLSGSFDKLIRVHGMRSGKLLKEMRGHSAYVNECMYTPDYSRILSCSSDGCIRLWDSKSADCLANFRPNSQTAAEISVNSVCFLPKSEHIVVSTRSKNVFVMTLSGQTVRTIISPDADVVKATVSRGGNWIFALTDKGDCHVFNASSGSLEHTVHVHDKEPIGIIQHPHRNIVATFADDGLLKLWRP